MSLFDTLGNKGKQTAPMNPMQMLQALKQNPASMLRQRGLTIPDGMTDPQQMAQYLLSSGQISQRRYNAAMQAAGKTDRN